MNVLIFGSGAVGLGLGSCLLKAGVETTLVAGAGTVEVLKTNGLRAKMLYNCALNPLGAILDVPYGTLAQNPHSRQLMDNVIEEIYAVMDSCRYATYWPTAEQYKDIFYNKLVPPTAEHKSSTLQDLQTGKKTEIEALTGQVLELAEKAGVHIPLNSMLYNLVRFIEEKNRV